MEDISEEGGRFALKNPNTGTVMKIAKSNPKDKDPIHLLFVTTSSKKLDKKLKEVQIGQVIQRGEPDEILSKDLARDFLLGKIEGIDGAVLKWTEDLKATRNAMRAERDKRIANRGATAAAVPVPPAVPVPAAAPSSAPAVVVPMTEECAQPVARKRPAAAPARNDEKRHKTNGDAARKDAAEAEGDDDEDDEDPDALDGEPLNKETAPTEIDSESDDEMMSDTFQSLGQFTALTASLLKVLPPA